MTERNGGTSLARDARPGLGLRVGVTGHRDLRQADPVALAGAVALVLDDLAAILNGLAAEAESRRLYADRPPVLRLVSPLAEGADRIVARLADARGWRLVAPLPFPRAEYERDFPATTAEFRTLLAKAEAVDAVVELDGTREAQDAAYLEVGRFVLRHSDVLIAIWNGETTAGTGGTGDIVTEARLLAIPVLHINSLAPNNIQLLWDAADAASYDKSAVALSLRRVMLPDWPPGGRHHAGAARDYLLRERVRVHDVLPDFLCRGPFVAPRSRLGRIFPTLVSLVGGHVTQKEQVAAGSVPGDPDNPAARVFYLQFQRADALATHYAEVHRSAFVLIYVLGSASLLAAFTALFLRPVGRGGAWTVLEALALGAILGLYMIERLQRWRERWLDYRVLAEALRQGDLLARIGRTPLSDSLDRVGARHPQRDWVSWLVAAIARSVGPIGARYDTAYLTSVRDYATRTRLADQIAYHERTGNRSAVVSRRLRRMSQVFFMLTLIAIGAEFAWPEDAGLPWPAWFAGILPAIAAASFGIRNQAEFEIVAHRSARLHELLTEARNRIVSLVPPRLTSTTLGAELQRAGRVMQGDTAEWAAIFEVKESEVV